jgi:hypothetical protein
VHYNFYSFSEFENFFSKRIDKKNFLQKDTNKYSIFLGFVDPWWKKVNYRVGEKVDVLDNQGIWYEGIIIEYKKNEYVKIHYRQWNSSFDQMFFFDEKTSENMIFHIAPAFTFIRNWRLEIKKGTVLEYLDPKTKLWYTGKAIQSRFCHLHDSCHSYFCIISFSTIFFHTEDDIIAPVGVHSPELLYFQQHFILNRSYQTKNGTIPICAEITIRDNRCEFRIVMDS